MPDIIIDPADQPLVDLLKAGDPHPVIPGAMLAVDQVAAGELQRTHMESFKARNALVLHAGAHAATREQVYETITPQATETHVPISHGTLLTLVTKALISSGLTVVGEAFGLWRDAQRFFGVLEVKNGQAHDDYGMLVGIRNSHDRSFAASLGLGSRVFVCDNMAFSAEVKIARVHSKFIMRDLPGLVDKGIGLLGNRREYQDRRIASYKDAVLTDKDAHDIVIRALLSRAINVQRVDDVVEQWYEPNHKDFEPRTVWSLFNGFTEALKGSGAELQPRTLKLHGLMDQVVGLPAFNFNGDTVEIDAEEITPVDDGDDADVRIEPRDEKFDQDHGI